MIRFENFLKRSLQDVFITSSRRLQNVLKTSWRYLENAFARRLEHVLKTSWRCLEHALAGRLEDVWKTSWRRLEDYHQDDYIGLDQDILKTSSSRRMFAGISFEDLTLELQIQFNLMTSLTCKFYFLSVFNRTELPEAIAQRCSIKKVFLEFSQN